MEAPEKIYLDSYGSGLSHGFHTNKLYDNDIEYIRKDAFIKDAVKWLKDNASDYVLYPMPELDESRLIEDFKKHIKGE